MKLQAKEWDDPDILTWVPVSAKRLRRRGYDQCQLLADSVRTELQILSTPCLKKIRHIKPQSRLRDAAQRKANVLGAFSVINPRQIAGKRILLLDDIVTTGATVSECARVLMTAGAKEVYCAAIAAAERNKM